MLGNDDLIALLGVGECLTLLHVGAGDTGYGGQTDCSLAARGGNAPLRAGELAQLRADAVHHLVQMDEVERSLVHGLLHLGQRARTADDRERAAAVHNGTNADPGEEVVVVRALFRKRVLRLRVCERSRAGGKW